MTGASASASFVSCMRSTSGAARSSHQRTFSRRAGSELTFHVAMRIGRAAPIRLRGLLEGRDHGELDIALQRARDRATVLGALGGVREGGLAGTLDPPAHLQMARRDAP